MDLRGFKSENRGCRFELGALAAAPHLRRVVLLHDADSDCEAATADLAGAQSRRFVWLEAGRLDAGKTGQVLATLFGAADDARAG